MSTAKRQISPASLAVAAGCSLLLGTFLAAVILNRSQHQSQEQLDKVNVADSPISPLLPLPPAQRTIPLEALAQLKDSQVGERARYLLATDRIQQRQGEAALTWLEGLDYPVLAAEIMFKRGQAYELAGNRAQAAATWQELLNRHPDHPMAAEALYALGRTQPQYWDRAIAQFPSHPRTIEIAQTRLKQNPKQPPLLLLLARHALYLPDITSILDRLSQSKDQLQPQDWEAIAFGYWQKQAYGKAAAAYARAPRTPRNAYRAARGLQLDGKSQQASQAYQRMVAQFPTAEETPRALIRLASLLPPRQGLQALDRAIQIGASPEQVGEALLAKVDLLDSLNSAQAVAQARQLLLTTYSKTEAAAEFRWLEAQKRAENQDFAGALKLAQQITTDNPESEFAPQATFWTAKWAGRLGSKVTAQRAFKQVLADYPESYYAWRAAALLGWSVGDFTTVRHLDPEVVKPNQRLNLPAGSAALKELYQLRQDRDAWVRWQWEYQNRIDPTMAEQLTDGLLRLGVGDNLEGIFMVSDLRSRSRSEPENRSQYQAWQQQPEYWQALYPLPFVEAVAGWSQQRGLNPLLVIALIRQESRFQPTIRSSAGAVGLMQVMPGTADWIADQTKLSRYTLKHPDDNIKLGTWYLDYTHQEYDNNSMLAVASYNAGPGNVADWVKKSGIGDPDQFVEAIPFPETKGYVKAVFENYWNYLRLYNPHISKLLQKPA